MDKFGGLAKLKEIITVLSKEQVPDAAALAEKLAAEARKPNSSSSFRRPIANDEGGSKFVPLEPDTILRHVKFAEKLGLAAYRASDVLYLPGLEPTPRDYSEEVVDDRIVKFLADKAISLNRLASAIDSLDFRDIDSIVQALFATNGRTISESDLKKCVRLLGDCGVSVVFSRKKAYAMMRRKR